MKSVPDKLLWLDLEMTGLDPEEDRILEVAAIVTDFDFEESGRFEAIVKQPVDKLERMKQGKWYDWSSGQRVVVGTVYDMAKENGLLDKIDSDGQDEKIVEQQLLDFIDKHFTSAVYLAGNSIHQDRRFIRRWLPRVEEKLHYRMIDVSSFKVLMQGKYKVNFKHPDSHRAIDGITGSIAELQYYLRKLQNES